MKGAEAALVDSGCTYSVISESLAAHLDLPVVQWSDEQGAPRDIGRRPIDVIGQTEAAVVLSGDTGDVILPFRCIVVPDLVSDVVLGASFLGATGAIPVVSEAKLLLPRQNDQVPMTTGLPSACALEDRTIDQPDTPFVPLTADEITLGEDMTSDQIARLLTMLNQYPELVRGSNPRRYTSIEEARFDLVEDYVPYWRQARSRSKFEEEVLEAEVQWRIDQGLMVRGPISDWSTPLFLVEKKGKTVEIDEDGKPLPGAMRLVQDLRRLNDVTFKEPNESLNIHQVIAKAGRHQYWFVCDMDKAFLSIRVREEDRAKTASTLPSGETVYNVAMPMGAVNSPAVWNRVATKAIRELSGSVAVWMDDLFSGADDMDVLLDRFELLLERLDTANLTISISKLVFGVREAEVLGLRLSKKGVSVKQTTRDTIRDYPQPQTTKEMRSFIGLVNFVSAWIPHASAKTMLLTQTLKKGRALEWTPERTEAFEAIKTAIVDSDPLAHVAELYEEGATIVVASDASTRALGAVLAVRCNDGTPDKPVMFSARTLAKRELAQGIPDLELAALVHGLEKFTPYIDGRPIVVQTDSRALKGMIETDDPAANRTRQRRVDFARTFNISDVEFIPGPANTGPDALTRITLARPPSAWAAAAEAEDEAVERRLAGTAASGEARRRSTRPRRQHNYRDMAAGRASSTEARDHSDDDEAGTSQSNSVEEEDEDEADSHTSSTEDGAPVEETTSNPSETTIGEGVEGTQEASQDTDGSATASTDGARTNPAEEVENADTAPSESRVSGAGQRAAGASAGGPSSQTPVGRSRRQNGFTTGSALDPALPAYPGRWTAGPMPGEGRLQLLLALEKIHAVRHVGRDGLVARARALGINEKGLTTAAKEVVAGCSACAAFKAYSHAHGAPGASISADVTLPNQRWCLDHAGYFVLGPERQKRWILVAVDVLSGYRMTELVESVSTDRTIRAIQAMMAREGVSHVAHLHADRGAAFQGQAFQEAFPDSIVSLSSAGHAQGNGLAETTVGTTKMDLRTTAGQRGITARDPIPEWVSLLAEVTHEYNVTPRHYGPAATQGEPRIMTTPYSLFQGKDPEDEAGVRDDGNTSQEELQAANVIPIEARITEVVKARKRAAETRQVKGRTPPMLKEGAEVWLKHTNSSSATPTLQRAKYDGPFVIVGTGPEFGPNRVVLTYKIRSPYHAPSDRNGPGKIKKVNVQELKPASTMRWKAIKTT